MNSIIGKKLQILRKDKGFSQEQVAENYIFRNRLMHV